MPKPIDHALARSTAAEAPLVIIYIAALIFIGFAWSNVSPPATSVMELHSAAMVKNAEKNEFPLP